MKISPSRDELKAAYKAIKGVKIPKIPQVVLDLQKEMSKADPNLKTIGDIIERDVALSGLLLKTVNAPIYGLAQKVTSISQAAVLLGLQPLKDVVLSSALKQSLDADTPFHQRFWKSAQSSALAAAVLGGAIEGINAELAYLSGFFQDAGALVLAAKYDDYAEVYNQGFINSGSILERETEIFGTNHAVIGFLLAKHWELPSKICLAIYNSHVQTCAEIKNSELRALIAVLKVTHHTLGKQLFPHVDTSAEAIMSLANAYMEMMVNSDALDDMTAHLYEGIDALQQ